MGAGSFAEMKVRGADVVTLQSYARPNEVGRAHLSHIKLLHGGGARRAPAGLSSGPCRYPRSRRERGNRYRRDPRSRGARYNAREERIRRNRGARE
jgi:hypothetical protein